MVDLGKKGRSQLEFRRPALSEPLAFFEGHAYGSKTYTNGADRDGIVAPKFRETMFDLLGGVEELNFGKLGWGDAELKALAVSFCVNGIAAFFSDMVSGWEAMLAPVPCCPSSFDKTK